MKYELVRHALAADLRPSSLSICSGWKLRRKRPVWSICSCIRAFGSGISTVHDGMKGCCGARPSGRQRDFPTQWQHQPPPTFFSFFLPNIFCSLYNKKGKERGRHPAVSRRRLRERIAITSGAGSGGSAGGAQVWTPTSENSRKTTENTQHISQHFPVKSRGFSSQGFFFYLKPTTFQLAPSSY